MFVGNGSSKRAKFVPSPQKADFLHIWNPGMTEMFFLTDEKRVKVRGPFF